MKATIESLRVLQDRLSAAKRASGLSNKQIGERAGVDPSQVSRIFMGDFKSISQSVLQICMVLEVEVPSLAGIARHSPGASPWPKLEASIHRLWDQTPEGLDRIANLLDLVARLRDQAGSEDHD